MAFDGRGRGAPRGLSTRGRGGGRGRGRGLGRGRGRARGRGRPAGGRDHGHLNKDWSAGEQFGAYQPKVVDDMVAEEEEEEEADDDFDLASAAPLAYNALLTLMKSTMDVEKPRKKKRKLESPHAPVEAMEDELADEEDDRAQLEEMDETDVREINEDLDDSRDPFESHFNDLKPDELELWSEAVREAKWSQAVELLPKGRKITLLPATETPMAFDSLLNPQEPAAWHLKHRLAESANKILETLAQAVDANSEIFVKHVFQYQDISHLVENYRHLPRLRSLYALHALNHIYKTRDKILKHNAKLSSNPDADVEYRDQGFVRPKVLIVVPTRNTCLQVIEQLITLSGAEQVENRKRFTEQFGTEGIDPLKNANKPDDFKALFAGNTDDAFRIGIKFTRKTIKLFSQFYGSDIIVASPLGLRMAIGDPSSKKRDWDLLSSIEMVILDGADAMAMQNWEHVDYIFEYLNTLPKEAHGCDYGRVRNWALEEKSKYLRQTILISEFEFPELRAMFSHLQNVAGKIRIKHKYDGAISDVGISIRQTFQRFQSESPAKDPDHRFDFFVSTTLPRLRKLAQVDGDIGSGTLLMVPSYFDFVRVRNHLTNQEISFEAISEYSSTADMTRSRQIFASGRSPILVITERLHHYRRYEFKGVKNVFFYQLPEHAKYFTELVRCSAVAGQSTSEGEVKVAFTRWDEARLERIVGTKRVGKMLSGKDSAFEFL